MCEYSLLFISVVDITKAKKVMYLMYNLTIKLLVKYFIVVNENETVYASHNTLFMLISD